MLFIVLLGNWLPTLAQTGVGIGTTAPDASAALDIVSSSKGALLPRVVDATAISNPATGLIVYQTNAPAGFYYNAGTAASPSWQQLATTTNGDNLGNHTATQDLNLADRLLVGGTATMPGTSGLTVTYGGRVGIGTTLPTTTLDVRAGSDAAITVGSNFDSNGALYFANGNHGLKRDYNGNGNSVGLFTTAGDVYLSSTGPGTGDQFVLQNGGNVGIGTSTPSQKLDVAGGLRARGLSGTGTRVLSALADGTLTTNSSIFTTSPNAPGTLAGAIGSASTDSQPVAVAVVGTRAYVANSSSQSLQIFDLSAATPALLGSVNAGNGSNSRLTDVAVSGNYAYVTMLYTGQLTAVNVSNPAAPVVVGTLAMPLGTYRVAVSGTRAYVIENYNLTIVDVSNPTSMTVLSRTAVNGNSLLSGVALSGTTAYVLDDANASLVAYDVSNVAAPARLGSVNTNYAPHDVALNGSLAYVTSSIQNTLQAIDISNPAAMSVVGSAATGPDPYRLALSGSKAYVAGHGDNTLRVYDLSTPGTPALQHALTTDSQPTAVAASGGTAYVTNEGSNTLQVFGYLPPRSVQVNADGTLASVPASTVVAGPGLSSSTSGTTTTIKLGGSALTTATDVPLAGQNLTFSGTGNVGVGTTGPSATLDVNGTARVRSLPATGTKMVTADANGNLGSATLPTDAQTLSLSSGNLSISGGNSLSLTAFGGNFILNQTNQQASSNFNVSGAGTVGGLLTAGSATVSGNVGIGTSSPTQKLDVDGGILARGSGLIGNQGAHLQWNRSGGVGETLLLNQQGGGGGGIVFGKSDSKTTGSNMVTEWARFNGAGHLLLGSSITNTTATGTSQAVEFVGPAFNSDPVGLYRTNPGSDQSELRVVVGDVADANDKFVVGRTNVSTEGALTGGTFVPSFTVQADGNSTTAGSAYVNGALGVVLNGQDRPLITRGYDLFTSGNYSGAGRWGVFMEPSTLTFGVPSIASKNFQWATYGANSAISTTLMTLLQGGNLGLGTTSPGQKLEVNGNVLVNSSYDLLLRDTNHGLGYYGTGKTWNTLALDGPALYGYSAGLLGTNQSGSQKAALYWNRSNQVGIGTTSPLSTLSLSSVTTQGNTAGQTIGELSFVGLSRPLPSASILVQSPNWDDAGFLIFKTSVGASGAQERMRLTETGLSITSAEKTGSLGAGVFLSGGTSGNADLELRGGTPYLDFAANTNTDYSSRLLSTTDALNVYVGASSVPALTVLGNVSTGVDRVGIGTTAPIAPLHVKGAASGSTVGGNTSFFTTCGGLASCYGQAANSGKNVVAYFESGEVWVNGYVVAGALQTTSDRRIKHIVGLSDRATDLALLNRLRITDYTYIDQVNHGPGVVKKVIAQEVEEVLPTAVTRSYQAIPNVYERATQVRFANGQVTLTTAKPHELPASGGRLRLYTPTNQELNVDVTVVDAHTVRFASTDAHVAGLFVYGKYVDDFRSVDYDALTTLNVSATQELARQVAELRAQNAALQTQASADHADLQTLKQQLARLLGDAPAPAQARK